MHHPSVRVKVSGLVISCLIILGTAVVSPSSPDAKIKGSLQSNIAAPKTFFSIAPIFTSDTPNLRRMSNNGIGAIRIPVSWAELNPEPGVYSWESFDQKVRDAAAHDLEVRPFLSITPLWLHKDFRAFPVHTTYQIRSWKKFLEKIVNRYRPQGQFWQENSELPRRYIRSWQIGNEPNASTFAVSPSASGYGKLLKLSYPVIKDADENAKVIMAGLYAQYGVGPPVSYTAIRFLDMMYKRYPNLNHYFDAFALHPYSKNSNKLRPLLKEVRRALDTRGAQHKPIWLTEMGWGSAYGVGETVFEKGRKGQATNLKRAYKLLLKQRRNWNIGQVTWFSWDDGAICDFCDSTGLFDTEGKAKPAWQAFKTIAEKWSL